MTTAKHWFCITACPRRQPEWERPLTGRVNWLAAAAGSEMLAGMKYLVAALLIAAGAYLIYCGHRRADSVAGVVEKTRKDIADAFDGRIRHPNYIVYYTGGGVLIAAGAWVAVRKAKG